MPLCGSFCFCMNDVPSIFGVASLIRTMSLNLWLAAHVARTLARAQREFGNDGRVVGRSSKSNPVRQTRALWFISWVSQRTQLILQAEVNDPLDVFYVSSYKFARNIDILNQEEQYRNLSDTIGHSGDPGP